MGICRNYLIGTSRVTWSRTYVLHLLWLSLLSLLEFFLHLGKVKLNIGFGFDLPICPLSFTFFIIDGLLSNCEGIRVLVLIQERNGFRQAYFLSYYFLTRYDKLDVLDIADSLLFLHLVLRES